jgi:hypothetical protein
LHVVQQRYGKLIKHYGMETRETGGIAPPLTAPLDEGGEWSASCPGCFTPRGKSPWYSMYRKLGRPQSWSGRCGEGEKSCPGWESNPGHPAHSPLLYRLSYGFSILNEMNT